jgi:hypothetical protein
VATPPDLAAVLLDRELIGLRQPSGLFDPDSAIQPLLPGGDLLTAGRSHRPQQTDMARQVAETFQNDTRSIIWSHASGETVVVAPNTKVLQTQIVATLEEMGDVAWAMIKGRGNYVDLTATKDLVEEAPESTALALALAIVVGWLSETPTGDWDDLEVGDSVRSRPDAAWTKIPGRRVLSSIASASFGKH